MRNFFIRTETAGCIEVDLGNNGVMRHGKGHQGVGGRTILSRQLEEMYVRLSLGIFLTFVFALLSALSGVDDNDWNWRMLETISAVNRVIEGLTLT